MRPFNFDTIYIDEASRDSDVAHRIQAAFPSDKIQWVDSQFMNDHKGPLSKDQFEWSKRNVLVTPFKGHFFKRCPGASQKTALTCCNYYVLNLGSQCNLNCSYCYLQSYLNTAIMKIYSNIDMAKAELLDMMKSFPKYPYRVGTGEIIDSLSMDELTLYSRQLIPLFKEFPHWTLEFKTKSDRVDQFLDLGPVENVHVSWSINPPVIIDSEEHGTARFEQRLTAARKIVNAGFKLAFHIDPIIYHEGWKENYAFLVDEIVRNFSPTDLKVISLGTLRFQPEQRLMMRERFGMNSLVNQAEMFTSDSGKMRYDWHLRTEMFQFVLNRFKNNNPAWNIFLCMETPETWATTLNKSPMKVDGLENLFRPLPKVKSETSESATAR
ncbi:MAG: hypothetical protein JNL11_03780 [Bdellovibrionaceae bacterium]|nr:hypothetical protein [Pseudobdellovibrionaceae bacterium]